MYSENDINQMENKVNKKYIRNIKPYNNNFMDEFEPQKQIEMKINEIPSYKMDNGEGKTFLDNSQFELNKNINNPYIPSQHQSMQNQPSHYQPIQTSVETYKPVDLHNCREFYTQISECPVCTKMYQKRDGIYITVIAILVIIILFLLKKFIIDKHTSSKN